jgi:hypothetical protein
MIPRERGDSIVLISGHLSAGSIKGIQFLACRMPKDPNLRLSDTSIHVRI